jgi:para-aminobenzoate synthetase/4-amino-4-deoxychorismate lyase
MTALPPEVPGGRYPLLLAPTGPRGWFGGVGVRAADPVEVAEGVTLSGAGAALEAAFDGDDPVLVAVLLPYEGPATVLTYREWTATDAPGAGIGHTSASLTPGSPLVRDPGGSLSGRRYRAAVREVRERIAAGDVYVLNLTYTLTGVAVAAGSETFAALHARAGAEMSAFLGLSDRAIASVSPERFVRVVREGEARLAEIWPIKGTCPRGANAVSDDALAARLARDPKERAEHVMVVDLERNDLGRVCEPGSVAADPLLEVVSTPYCHQMVSRVRGTLRPEATFAELLEATFPCGSVTGAPKIAAMRIAGELEQGARGAYTGALVIARPGELDSSVLIRTAVLAGETLSWGTGCGITCDSDPAEEWLETLLKASPLLGDTLPPVALRETCRIVRGQVPLLAYHLARLSAGGCGPSVLAEARVAVDHSLGAADPKAEYGRLAVTVSQGGAVTAELGAAPSTLAVRGGPLAVPVTVAGPPELPPGAAKPADRGVWDAAQREAGPGAQAVLVLSDGTVVDGATASVWVRRGDALLTPPAPPAVAGVARAVVLDLAAGCGYAASAATLALADLDTADEVFFSNALAGVVAARGRGGPACAALTAAFEREFGFPSGRV